MRILIPIIGFGKAGGYRTLSNLASCWVSMGHEVDFVITIDSEPYFPTKAKIIMSDYKGNKCDGQCPKCALKGKARFVGLRRYIKNHEKDYDVILGSHNITLFLASFINRKKLFYYIQAYEPEFYKFNFGRDGIIRTVAALTYKLPSIRIVNADIYKKYKILKSRYVIPPGLDLKLYYPQINQWDRKRPLVIGTIGRVEEWKGSGDVAKAVSILQSKNCNIHFKVAFNPVDGADYELVKPDGDENLSAYYRSLDVLVAPGKLQLGAVHYPVIEAMASGTIVITTGYYPASEDNSYIVPISDPEAIARIIEHIMDNYDEAYAKMENALKEVQRFDWAIVSKQFIDVFEKEIKKR